MATGGIVHAYCTRERQSQERIFLISARRATIQDEGTPERISSAAVRGNADQRAPAPSELRHPHPLTYRSGGSSAAKPASDTVNTHHLRKFSNGLSFMCSTHRGWERIPASSPGPAEAGHWRGGLPRCRGQQLDRRRLPRLRPQGCPALAAHPYSMECCLTTYPASQYDLTPESDRFSPHPCPSLPPVACSVPRIARPHAWLPPSGPAPGTLATG